MAEITINNTGDDGDEDLERLIRETAGEMFDSPELQEFIDRKLEARIRASNRRLETFATKFGKATKVGTESFAKEIDTVVSQLDALLASVQDTVEKFAAKNSNTEEGPDMGNIMAEDYYRKKLAEIEALNEQVKTATGERVYKDEEGVLSKLEKANSVLDDLANSFENKAESSFSKARSPQQLRDLTNKYAEEIINSVERVTDPLDKELEAFQAEATRTGRVDTAEFIGNIREELETFANQAASRMVEVVHAQRLAARQAMSSSEMERIDLELAAQDAKRERDAERVELQRKREMLADKRHQTGIYMHGEEPSGGWDTPSGRSKIGTSSLNYSNEKNETLQAEKEYWAQRGAQAKYDHDQEKFARETLNREQVRLDKIQQDNLKLSKDIEMFVGRQQEQILKEYEQQFKEFHEQQKRKTAHEAGMRAFNESATRGASGQEQLAVYHNAFEQSINTYQNRFMHSPQEILRRYGSNGSNFNPEDFEGADNRQPFQSDGGTNPDGRGGRGYSKHGNAPYVNKHGEGRFMAMLKRIGGPAASLDYVGNNINAVGSILAQASTNKGSGLGDISKAFGSSTTILGIDTPTSIMFKSMNYLSEIAENTKDQLKAFSTTIIAQDVTNRLKELEFNMAAAQDPELTGALAQYSAIDTETRLALRELTNNLLVTFLPILSGVSAGVKNQVELLNSIFSVGKTNWTMLFTDFPGLLLKILIDANKRSNGDKSFNLDSEIADFFNPRLVKDQQ